MKKLATYATAIQAAEFIQQRAPHFKPTTALILGSGLNNIATRIQHPLIIDYQEIPGFVAPSVTGHAGKLCLGELNGRSIVCLQGRVHLYEGISPHIIATMINTLKLLGCSTLFITNTTGSLRPEMVPGSLMLINDHINFQFSNPLVGLEEEWGPRFVGMEDAYDPQLRQQLLMLAKQANIPLFEGVYIGVLGPSFETPAEIRAFRLLGADAVGMSTIPEVIVARQCGLRVAAISVISNLAAGCSDTPLSHELTLAGATLGLNQLTELIFSFISHLA